MIAPMRKVTVMALASGEDATLNALRDAGVLHVETRQAATGEAVKSAATTTEIEAVQRALTILGNLDGESGKTSAPVSGDAAALTAKVLDLQARLSALAEEQTALRVRRAAQLPFGEFDPASLASLAARGIAVVLFRLPAKRVFPAGEGIAALGEQDSYRYGAAFGALPELPELEILPAPTESLSSLDTRLAQHEAEAQKLTEALSDLGGARTALEAHLAGLAERRTFELVGESLAASGPLVLLDGYCPVEALPKLEGVAKVEGWALWIREPDADDNVPVKLNLPRWLRPIVVLFKGLGIMPGYREVDVSAVFLLFFSLFFAMLVGDAGYGALMLAVVLFARRKKPQAPAQPFWLFGIFAVATIVWGFLTGSFFAIESESLPRFMRGLPWLSVDDNVMWLCFLIGGVHLTIAHLWNAILLLPSRKALSQVGWIGVVWLMFYIAGNLVVGQAIPSFMPWVGAIGVLLIVLFMTDPKDFKEEWINHPMLVLDLISCLVDVISYIRLFAVGMASAQIAMNFNAMALGLPLPVWIKPLGVVLILVLGHGLNIVLGALSILVHAVRLNTLEFSNHIGLTWSGQAYQPFRKTS